jgi:FixJ family two-component response regulator/signal transduction histidine kinase
MEMGVRSLILVVDDDPVVRTAICAFLEALDHAHACVSSCSEAAAAIKEKAFSCGIIDLHLPDGNGLGLLPALKQYNPCCVPIILTGDNRPETIVETMRAGAFDYLMKPVDLATFEASLIRAFHHHEAIQERDRLHAALTEERSLLQTRVEETAAELREHARRIELVNSRQQVLLSLNQMSEESYTEETFFRSVFDYLVKHVPLECIALTTAHAYEYFIAAVPAKNGETVVVTAETPGRDPLPVTSTDLSALLESIRASLNLHAGLDAQSFISCLYPQTSLGRIFGAVAFFFPPDYVIDEEFDRFLQACASVLTLKWQDLRLFYYAAKQASVGNMALDLARDMVQDLTAIQMAAEVVLETEVSPEAEEGLRIIENNTDNLRRRLNELRQLSTPQKNVVETVELEKLVDQALELLSTTIEHRGIVIDKEYLANGRCVLFNGTALARTFHDLISSAVRAVQNNHHIVLRLRNSEPNSIMFEINYDGINSELFGVARRVTDQSAAVALGHHPKFIMAQRTIRGCGGTLSVEHKMEGWCAFSVVLPKNALSSSRELEEIGLS